MMYSKKDLIRAFKVGQSYNNIQVKSGVSNELIWFDDWLSKQNFEGVSIEDIEFLKSFLSETLRYDFASMLEDEKIETVTKYIKAMKNCMKGAITHLNYKNNLDD